FGQAELDKRFLLPDGQGPRGLRVATGQAAEQLLRRGGRDEDEQPLRHPFADEGRALDVDLEDDVLATVEGGFDSAAGGPVIVVVDLGPLQEFLLLDQAEEFRLGDEGVAVAVDLPRSWRPG